MSAGVPGLLVGRQPHNGGITYNPPAHPVGGTLATAAVPECRWLHAHTEVNNARFSSWEGKPEQW